MTLSPYYPPANRTAQWFATAYPGIKFSRITRVVLHTTETSGWPGYGGGASAPTLTCKPNTSTQRLEWRQHFPLNMSARALVHPSGCQTNNMDCVQVEMIGTCDKGGPGMYWPEAPEWALQGIADFLAFMNSEWSVALSAAPRWLPYPSSYGNTAVRFSCSQWTAFRGTCGHQHVVGNDHGDPGNINAQRIIALAGGSGGGGGGDDDVVTQAEIEQIAGTTVSKMMLFIPPGQPLNVQTIFARAYPQAMENTKLNQMALTELDQIESAIEDLSNKITAIVIGSGGSVDVDALAMAVGEEVANQLAARLAERQTG